MMLRQIAIVLWRDKKPFCWNWKASHAQKHCMQCYQGNEARKDSPRNARMGTKGLRACEPGSATSKAPMCCVMPPASLAATAVLRSASSREVCTRTHLYHPFSFKGLTLSMTLDTDVNTDDTGTGIERHDPQGSARLKYYSMVMRMRITPYYICTQVI